jgi:acyl-CoA thioester hydrolase
MASDAAPILDAAGDADTNQPLAGRTPRFAAYFKVRHYEMDAYGHVNNAVYLHYLEQAAIEHSADSGFPDERARELGGAWVVRTHEIEYLRPAAAGDVLQVVTWAVEFKGARAYRDYAIFRVDIEASGHEGVPADGFLASDQIPTSEPLVRARTLWVWADRVSGRPRRIPPEMYPAFLGAAAASP